MSVACLFSMSVGAANAAPAKRAAVAVMKDFMMVERIYWIVNEGLSCYNPYAVL